MNDFPRISYRPPPMALDEVVTRTRAVYERMDARLPLPRLHRRDASVNEFSNRYLFQEGRMRLFMGRVRSPKSEPEVR